MHGASSTPNWSCKIPHTKYIFFLTSQVSGLVYSHLDQSYGSHSTTHLPGAQLKSEQISVCTNLENR